MGLITKMRSQMQIVMWTILILFVISMAIGGLVGGANIGDIFGQRQADEIGSVNEKPIFLKILTPSFLQKLIVQLITILH